MKKIENPNIFPKKDYPKGFEIMDSIYNFLEEYKKLNKQS
jgi:hypothetical protein